MLYRMMMNTFSLEKKRFQQQSASHRNPVEERTTHENNEVLPFEPFERSTSSRKSKLSLHQTQRDKHIREQSKLLIS